MNVRAQLSGVRNYVIESRVHGGSSAGAVGGAVPPVRVRLRPDRAISRTRRGSARKPLRCCLAFPNGSPPSVVVNPTDDPARSHDAADRETPAGDDIDHPVDAEIHR